MSYRVAVDIGGTFTDLISVDDEGNITIAKTPSTPPTFADGIFDGLDEICQAYGISLKDYLEQVSSFVGGAFIHGSTVATNALVEGKTAKVGLICTKGFRDVLLFREGGKDNPFKWRVDYPEPYVPRRLTFGVTERINAEGEVEVPLNEGEVRQAISELKEENVEVIAVALLFSFLNPVHELRIGEIIKEEWPGLPFKLSHQVNPIIREYRRTSSTVIDASLYPILSRYLADLDDRLVKAGYKGSLSIVTATGGFMSVREVEERPIYTVGSGPATGPVAGLTLTKMEMGRDSCIVTDLGGTSFDVSIVTNGNIPRSRETKIDSTMLGIARVDTKSIGAGGGSIAWFDAGGMLRVGPQSSGARPGPACYMRGGKEATVTDANVILGYLDPDYFLGGRMKIDPKLSEEVIKEKIAGPLNMSLLEAASAITTVLEHNMVAAITEIVIWQGVDPREYPLFVGGGAGGLHVANIAKELEMKEILISSIGGVLCAMGAQYSDAVGEFFKSYYTETRSFDYEGVNKALEEIEEQGRDFLSRIGTKPGAGRLDFYSNSRYSYQIWEITVPLRGSRIRNEAELAQFTNDFHDAHERIFAVKEPGASLECLLWGVYSTLETTKPKMVEQSYAGEDPSAALIGKRKAYFKELGGLVDTPLYKGDKLGYGNKINAPAVILEETSTVVISPGWSATVTKSGNYLLESK